MNWHPAIAYPQERHAALLKAEDPKAVAVQWIIEYCKNLTEMVKSYCDDYDEYFQAVTLKDIMDCIMSRVDGERYPEHIVRRGTFEGDYVDMTVWEKAAIAIGKEIPEEVQGNFFSCSC